MRTARAFLEFLTAAAEASRGPAREELERVREDLEESMRTGALERARAAMERAGQLLARVAPQPGKPAA